MHTIGFEMALFAKKKSALRRPVATVRPQMKKANVPPKTRESVSEILEEYRDARAKVIKG